MPSTAPIFMKLKRDQQCFLRDLCTEFDENLRNKLVSGAGSWKNFLLLKECLKSDLRTYSSDFSFVDYVGLGVGLRPLAYLDGGFESYCGCVFLL